MARTSARSKAVPVEAGLGPAELEKITGQLASGASPRVRIISGQADAGTGSVVRIGDPAVDGAEYVIVRVKVGGVADELPFAPSELAVGKKPVPPEPIPAAAPRRARRTKPSAAIPSTPAPSRATPAPSRATPAAAKPTPTAAPTASPARRRKADTPLPVGITLTSAGDSWTLTATRGAKTIAKALPVRPGVISAITGLLEHEELSAAAAAINERARESAQQRADALRAELAEVEAILQSQQTPG